MPKKKQHEKTGPSVENECNLAQYKQFVNCLCVNRSKTFWIQSNRVNFGYKLLKLFQNLKLTLKIGRKLGFIDQQSIQADTTSQRYGWAQDKLGWGFRVQSAVMEAYEIYKWQKRRQSPGGSGQISLNKNIYCHVYLIVSLHFFALLLSGICSIEIQRNTCLFVCKICITILISLGQAWRLFFDSLSSGLFGFMSVGL